MAFIISYWLPQTLSDTAHCPVRTVYVFKYTKRVLKYGGERLRARLPERLHFSAVCKFDWKTRTMDSELNIIFSHTYCIYSNTMRFVSCRIYTLMKLNNEYQCLLYLSPVWIERSTFRWRHIQMHFHERSLFHLSLKFQWLSSYVFICAEVKLPVVPFELWGLSPSGHCRQYYPGTLCCSPIKLFMVNSL